MIKDKRNSLESFIKEQLIGPGGCGNNFGVYVSMQSSIAFSSSCQGLLSACC